MVNTINIQAKPLSGDENVNTGNIVADENSKSSSARQKSFKFSCQLCNQKFKKKDALDRHVFKHTGEKAYTCDFDGCDKKYSNKSHLNRHKKTSHTDLAEEWISCSHPGCHQMFTNQSNANRHYQVQHSKRVSHICSDCGEGFRRKMQLKRHMILKHTGEFSNFCTQCGKGFLNIKSLKHHLRSHEAHECPLCSETFHKWSQLVKHRRDAHRTQEIKFICDLCDKTFCRKANIKEHVKTHTMSDIVYMCHYENCSKFYTARRNLNSHIRSKHEGKAGWTCDKCNQQLSTKQKLIQHLRAHLDPSRTVKLYSHNTLSFVRLVPSTHQQLKMNDVKINFSYNYK